MAHEVLAMPVAEAAEFFGAGEARTPAAHKILQRLADVGLGYLTIGQPLTTLSGGERQRLKLATRMAEKARDDSRVYVLDEPTSGLHLADIERLLGLLDRLVDGGLSVIVIEHHQAVMAHADWIIDLGPAPATTAAGSSSRAHPPTSSPPPRRIERAMVLLRRGDLSVTEVCFAVGCSSLAPSALTSPSWSVVSPSTQTTRATAGMPSCVAKQVTRPIRNREVPVTEPQLA